MNGGMHMAHNAWEKGSLGLNQFIDNLEGGAEWLEERVKKITGTIREEETAVPGGQICGRRMPTSGHRRIGDGSGGRV